MNFYESTEVHVLWTDPLVQIGKMEDGKATVGYRDALTEEVLSRARDALSELHGDSERDAARVVELSQRVLLGEASDGPGPSTSDAVVTVEEAAGGEELARLAELLARRNSKGMPFAALARATLAAQRGADADCRALLRECRDKLALFGF